MSYTIVYDKKFVKTQRGIIPIVLSGSSNCYTTNIRGQEVRTRDWGVFVFAARPMPAEALMEEVMKLVPSTYGEHFMYNGKWVNDEGFVNFFKSGVKNALTLDELMNKYRAGSLRVAVEAKDLESTREFAPHKCVFSAACRTNDELEEALTNAFAAYEAQPGEAYPRFDYSFGYERERLETKIKQRRRGGNSAKTGYLLRLGNGCYFVNRSSAHLWFSAYTSDARHFRSREEAERYCLENLRGYKVAAETTIVAQKYIITMPSESGRPSEKKYWVGPGFSKEKAFAKTFNTERQAGKEKDAALLATQVADNDIDIVTELFEVGVVSKPTSAVGN